MQSRESEPGDSVGAERKAGSPFSRGKPTGFLGRSWGAFSHGGGPPVDLGKSSIPGWKKSASDRAG